MESGHSSLGRFTSARHPFPPRSAVTEPPKRRWLLAGRELFSMLSVRSREIALLVGLAVMLAMVQALAAGMLAPVLQYIEFGKAGGSGIFGTLLYRVLDLLGLPVTLLTLLMLAFVPILLREVIYLAYVWYTARVQQRAAVRLRSTGFAAIVHGDLAFAVHEGNNRLLSTLTAQVQRGGSAIAQFLQQISIGLLIVMYVVVLLVLQLKLTLITVAALVIISFLVNNAIKRSRTLGGETSQLNNETYAVISERIMALRLIKMLGQEGRETRNVTEVVTRFGDAQARIGILSGIVEITIDPLQMLMLFAVIFVGVQFFHASLATIGLFLFIMLQLNTNVKAFNNGRQTLSANIDSLRLVRDTFDRANASRHIVGGSKPFTALHEGIRLEGVSFAYSDETEELVLKGVDLEIPCRSQTAIVGKSGAGKSTLVDLIPRLRDPNEGRILFDGRPVQEFDLRTLRRSIGFMTQDALLFNDTVFNNLVYGLEREPADDEIEGALKASFCSKFVKNMPNGLKTNIGDRGVRLSGGERQRLALARVFLQDPEILILDEPTSALDSESEKYIQRALDSVRHRKTLIVIAHRLSTVQRSDQIVVLDHGVIEERGTHADLLAAEGAYRKLFDFQIYG
jgi:subfamily B ATP-binding cassette protein MsbA